jgi:Putative restriction endonuclease
MSTAPNTTTTDSIDSLAPVVTSKLYTPEELLTLPDQKIYELVDGRLVEKNRGGNSSWIGQELNRHVGNFVYEHGLGLLWGPDCSYQIFGDDGNKIRRPDGSFLLSSDRILSKESNGIDKFVEILIQGIGCGIRTLRQSLFLRRTTE